MVANIEISTIIKIYIIASVSKSCRYLCIYIIAQDIIVSLNKSKLMIVKLRLVVKLAENREQNQDTESKHIL